MTGIYKAYYSLRLGLICMLSCIFCNSLKAQQQPFTLHINSSDSSIIGRYAKVFISPADRQSELNRIQSLLYAGSYLAAGFDSSVISGNHEEAYLHIGIKYTWAKLKPGTIRPEVLQSAGFRELSFLNKPVSNTTLVNLYDKLLEYYEDNGYPFAEISLDSLEFSGNTVSAYLNATENGKIVFDTIEIRGDARLKKQFLAQYLGIMPGAPYSETAYRKADQKLRSLPYAFLVKSTDILFITNKARPVVYLNHKKSDQANGIIGFAPNTTSGTNSTKLLLTGEFRLKLQNLFRSGKMFELNWRSFRARSQELKSNLQLPYLARTPLGLDLHFNFLKFDTLYATIDRQAGIQYLFSGVNAVKVYYNVTNTNLNTVDTAFIRQTKQLPTTNATTTKSYGISTTINTLDYIFNPRRGVRIDLSASAGSRHIDRDARINAITFTDGSGRGYSIYDSVTLKTNQYRIKYELEKFFPIGQAGAIKAGALGEHLVSDNIFFNEVMRFGGINSLRGFNEQSLFATSYTVVSFEYRYLISQNSFVQVFWNGAYYEDYNISRAQPLIDMPWGFGVGANLDTGSGILSLAYALGKEKSNNFDLRTGKIHFGLSSYF